MLRQFVRFTRPVHTVPCSRSSSWQSPSRPCIPSFAAECSGLDIGEPLSADEAAAIDQGMDRYAVLVFRRATPLTTEQQIAFTRNFGELELTPFRGKVLSNMPGSVPNAAM
jgi:alpha-ketoglutarate-dependent taurine dioxygenase